MATATQQCDFDIAYLLARRDSWPAHVKAMGQNAQLHRMVIGIGGNANFYLTHPRRNLLILGPPRQRAGSAGQLAVTGQTRSLSRAD